MEMKPGARADTIEELARLVKSVAFELDRVVTDHLGGLTVRQWHVLAALEGGAGKPMTALAEVTLLPGPSLTRLVDGMVDDNLVLRKADVVDRRRLNKSEQLDALCTSASLQPEALTELLGVLQGSSSPAALRG